MALKDADYGVVVTVEPPPLAGGLSAVAGWAHRAFKLVGSWTRRPEAPVYVFARLESAGDPNLAKPQDGMMVYAGADVLGPQAGFYVREESTWKKVAGT